MILKKRRKLRQNSQKFKQWSLSTEIPKVKFGPRFLKVQASSFIKELYFWPSGLLLLLLNARRQRLERQNYVFKQQAQLISGCSWKLLSFIATWDQQFSILYTIHAAVQSQKKKTMIQISKSKLRIFLPTKGWISLGLHSISSLLFCHPAWCT